MPVQKENAEQVSLLATHFPLRNDSTYSWGQALSGLLLTPRLRGLWGVSIDENNLLYDHSGQVRTLTGAGGAGTPLAYQNGIAPYHEFIRANTQYYTRADEAGLDITDDLTLWVWVNNHAPVIGAGIHYVGKYDIAGNQRAYLLYKDSTEIYRFYISSLGTAASTVNIPAIAADFVQSKWTFLAGRFVPSTTMDLWVGSGETGVLNQYTLAAGVPAAIFNSSAALQVGCGDAASAATMHDGYLSLWGLAAYACSDADIFTKFHLTRPLFMW